MNQPSFSFLGLGLIGGSIAKALKAAYPKCHIRAYDSREETLGLAQSEGIADEIFPILDESSGSKLCRSDYLFLCAPVSHNNENLLLIRPFLHPNLVLTDVGSVKTGIHEQIRRLGLEANFIGGHPMAGSERIGYQNSKASLLENAYYILTPAEGVLEEKVKRYAALIRDMGALPLCLDYRQHDFVTAAVSHLPHIIASSLVNLVKDTDSEDGIMKMIAAGGFKDITRIASSSTIMWQQICMTNSVNISDLLGRYITSLQKIRDGIDRMDSKQLYSFFDNARSYRESFIDSSSGPIKKAYTIHVEIPDEAGSLAAVATLLALNQINIKNIGITHNRESQDGVLRIEFHEPDAIGQAVRLLENRGYSVFPK